MKLSIVVPFYNEEQNIPLVLNAFRPFYPKYEFELLCINDGSKDGTFEVFKQLQHDNTYPFARFISYTPNGGYGNAIMVGVHASNGTVISWTHSDMQTEPADVFRGFDLFTSLGDEMNIIKGVRIKRPLPQVIFSFGMAIISSIILRKIFFEVNAQPKLFHRRFISALTQAPRDFSLDLYMLYISKKLGYKIKTIDVEFKNRIHGQSSWGRNLKSRVKTIWRTIKYIWNLRTY